jgi:hypothetical protein
MRTSLIVGGLAFCAAIGGFRALRAQPLNFDKLTDADRKVFAERFEREIWPLLVKDGKYGCVGCHLPSSKIVSSLRMSGDPKKDFPMLVRDGYFLHPDAGSFLARVMEKDLQRRMPKSKAAWPEKDIQTLRKFVEDMSKKQQN